jgi:uncharacterized protein (TIGR02246 family)
MRRLLVALLVLPSLTWGAETKAGSTGDPMAGWVPPKVKNEAKDKQEIQALLKTMESAGKTGDLDAAAALVDFPVMMMTDDSKGQAKGEAWDRDKWTEVMRPFYANPMKDMKVTHKPTVFLLSDSLASVDDVCTMSHGGKTITSRSSMLVTRTDGKWRVKAMAEGGWGDMMASQGTASGSQGPASGQGTGSSAGGAAEPPAPSQGAGSDTQPQQERTTK